MSNKKTIISYIRKKIFNFYDLHLFIKIKMSNFIKLNLTNQKNKIMSDFQLIEKEEVASLKFPDKDVMSDKDDVIQRKLDLERALTLGNLEHLKIKIFFEDDSSKRVTETTVWGITADEVILKKGVVIPIKRIHKII